MGAYPISERVWISGRVKPEPYSTLFYIRCRSKRRSYIAGRGNIASLSGQQRLYETLQRQSRTTSSAHTCRVPLTSGVFNQAFLYGLAPYLARNGVLFRWDSVNFNVSSDSPFLLPALYPIESVIAADFRPVPNRFSAGWRDLRPVQRGWHTNRLRSATHKPSEFQRLDPRYSELPGRRLHDRQDSLVDYVQLHKLRPWFRPWKTSSRSLFTRGASDARPR